MYLILVYDVAVKRVARVMKFCRRFLHHVQNSVFEGELSDAKIKKLENGLMKLLNHEEDSVIIFKLWADYSIVEKKILGKEKNKIEFVV